MIFDATMIYSFHLYCIQYYGLPFRIHYHNSVLYRREHSPINIINIRYEHNLIDTLNIIHFVLSITQKIELHLFNTAVPHYLSKVYFQVNL